MRSYLENYKQQRKEARKLHQLNKDIHKVNPHDLVITQRSVRRADVVSHKERFSIANTYRAPPLDVVQMKNRQLRTLDHRRLQAAREAGVDANIVIHKFDDPLPVHLKEKFSKKKKKETRIPSTYGEATEARIWAQGGREIQEGLKKGKIPLKVNERLIRQQAQSQKILRQKRLNVLRAQVARVKNNQNIVANKKVHIPNKKFQVSDNPLQQAQLYKKNAKSIQFLLRYKKLQKQKLSKQQKKVKNSHQGQKRRQRQQQARQRQQQRQRQKQQQAQQRQQQQQRQKQQQARQRQQQQQRQKQQQAQQRRQQQQRQKQQQARQRQQQQQRQKQQQARQRQQQQQRQKQQQARQRQQQRQRQKQQQARQRQQQQQRQKQAHQRQLELQRRRQLQIQRQQQERQRQAVLQLQRERQRQLQLQQQRQALLTRQQTFTSYYSMKR